MRLEELKNELPETPDFIHNMIKEEVARQVENTKVADISARRKMGWNIRRLAFAAAACLAVSSSVAYAGSQFYRMYLEKQGNYSVSIGIASSEEDSPLKLPKQIHDIEITSSYIPEGMEWTEEGVKLSYKDTPCEGGISVFSVLMDQDDLKEALLDKFVVESEERSFGDYEGIYLRRDDLQNGTFNQRIYLICPKEYRILTIYIGKDVSKEDAIRFAEGICITEKDEVMDTDDLYTWSDYLHPETYSGELPVTNGMLPIYSVGESFYLDWADGEDAEGHLVETNELSVCVDEVLISDDLSPLQEGNIPKEWSAVTGEDGKLLVNHLSYIKEGDGVDRLNQVVKEENAPQKLVYVTVTYTNHSEEELHHILYLGELLSLTEEEDGSYSICVPEETPGDGYDYYVGDGAARMNEMKYYSIQEDYGDGGNYISALKPGESVQVHMAWIVNEKDLENLYLNLSPIGGSYELNEHMMASGLVSIGK